MDLKHDFPRVAAEPGALDVERAVAFLHAQAHALQQGLEHSDDAAAVAAVLAEHDASHDTWLCLAAGIERSGNEAASDRFANLYAFHGRVAGSLERRLESLVDVHIAGQIRTDLAERLSELTEVMVWALRGSTTRRTAPRTHRRSPG